MVIRTNMHTGTKEIIGTAAEKATFNTTALPAFSTWWEKDTRTGYVWDGSAWCQV